MMKFVASVVVPRHTRRRALATLASVAQPQPSSHPHLFGLSDTCDNHHGATTTTTTTTTFSSTHLLTPNLAAAEFATRRRKVSASLPPGGLLLVPAAPTAMMSHDVPYPYRQDADLLYLTGLQEPGCMLALDHAGRTVLFMRAADEVRDLWDGPSTNAAAATEWFGLDEACHLSSPAATGLLRSVLAEASSVLVPQKDGNQGGFAQALRSSLGDDQFCDQVLCGAEDIMLASGETKGTSASTSTSSSTTSSMSSLLLSGRSMLDEARVKKSSAELALHRRAAAAAGGGFARAMAVTKPGLTEAALAAHLEFEMKAGGGAQRMAFPPIVAGGINGNTLHYLSNSHVLNDGDLVLVDAGAEVDGYCSDVTRTWPVNGRFTEAQRLVYEAVLDANKQCIELCAEPGISIADLHRHSLDVLEDHVRDLLPGLIPPSSQDAAAAKSEATAALRRVYPHGVGHWLGVDTHDAPRALTNVSLEPGHVLTIEPGLYIPDTHDIPEEFRGIAVRIEDDVAILGSDTAGGAIGAVEVLTAGIPKEVDDLEDIIGQ